MKRPWDHKLSPMEEQVAAIRAVGVQDFRPWADAAVRVYADAMHAPRRQINARRPIVERHVGYRGFRAHIAVQGDTLVGFCYGFHGEPGQWWHDAVARGMAGRGMGDEVDGWLGDYFEVAELQVVPEHQKRGIGRALLTGLCAERDERTVMLSTHDIDSPARLLYRSHGFVELMTGFYFPAGGETFIIMGAPLPLRGDPASPAA